MKKDIRAIVVQTEIIVTIGMHNSVVHYVAGCMGEIHHVAVVTQEIYKREVKSMNNERGIQRGKDFESIIRKNFEEAGAVVERLPDPTNGYLGIRNKSDFIVYRYPYQYYIECKTVHSHRLPMYNITFNQRVGMLEVVPNKGIIAGIMCWFISLDRTLFIPIEVIEEYRLADVKSINLNKMDDKRFIEIHGEKKRVYFDYDLGQFLDYCEKHKLGERS